MIKRKKWYHPKKQDIREALAICIDSTYWDVKHAIKKKIGGSIYYTKKDKTFEQSLHEVFQKMELVLQTQMIALNAKHPEFEGRIKSLNINLHHLFLTMVVEVLYLYMNQRPTDLKNLNQALSLPALILVEVLQFQSLPVNDFIQTKLLMKYQWK